MKDFIKEAILVNAESVGIGLALTKVIIERQGGTILVNSKREKEVSLLLLFKRNNIENHYLVR